MCGKMGYLCNFFSTTIIFTLGYKTSVYKAGWGNFGETSVFEQQAP